MEFWSWVEVISSWSRGNMLEPWCLIIRYCHAMLKCAFVKHTEFYNMKSEVVCKIFWKPPGRSYIPGGNVDGDREPSSVTDAGISLIWDGGGTNNMLNQIPSGISESLRLKTTEAAFPHSNWLRYCFSHGSGSTILTPLGMCFGTWQPSRWVIDFRDQVSHCWGGDLQTRGGGQNNVKNAGGDTSMSTWLI